MPKPIRLRELNEQEFARIEGRETAQGETSAFEALARMMGEEDVKLENTSSQETGVAEGADAVEADAGGEVDAALPTADEGSTLFAAAQVEPTEHTPERRSSALEQLRQRTDKRRAAHRSTLDTLNLLRCLSPIFRAAEVYPGPQASPANVARAIRVMSAVSVGLANEIVRRADHLELDSAWGLKTLQSFTADVVAHHWMSMILAKGGAAEMPEISVDHFLPAVETVLALEVNLSGRQTSFSVSNTGAVQLSLLKALTPLMMDIEDYAQFVALHIDRTIVQVDKLAKEISQFLLEQAMLHQERCIRENPDISEDTQDRLALLQAMINHCGAAVTHAWQTVRGEVFSVLQQARSSDEAAAVFQRPEMSYGVPLEALKARSAAMIARVVGAVSYAMKLKHAALASEQKV